MILLIADLHLEPGRPDLLRAFLRFVEGPAREAEALYILGDFFEVWIGDDGMDAFAHEVAQALRALADSGTRIYLMHGNRDFLLGKGFCRLAGARLLADPSVLDHQGQRVLLMHGDSLCTQDEGYMRLRRVLRNPLSLLILRNLPLSTRRKLARKLRNQSRAETRQKATDIVDVTPDEVSAVMRRHGVHTLIHGHTHRPATHDFLLDGEPARRIVLGDWDRRGWVLCLDGQGPRQVDFALEDAEQALQRLEDASLTQRLKRDQPGTPL